MLSTSSDEILNLGALVAASRDLASRAGLIIQTIYEGGDLQVVDKAFGEGRKLLKSEELKAQDPTTVADVTAQKLIIGSLQKQFPGLRICGEEEDTKISDDDIVIPNMEFDKEIPKQYDSILVKDCCVWVDPIDGTKEYTEGIKEAVTTLIGIAHKGRPIAGIIGRPFNQQVIWGVVGLGAFGYNKPKQEPRDLTRRIICTTRSHFKPSMKSYIAACDPTGFVRAGGSGGKVLMVIEGDADAYVFPSLGTKKWDTCAPEAVLLSLGGNLTKPDGTLYEYDPDKCEAMNSEGFIATVFNKEYHNSFLEQNITIEQVDLTIFGATGFTGKLVAEYIAEQYLNPADSVSKTLSNYSFALAGRNMKKLEALLDDLCKINENAKKQFKLIECDAMKSQDCEKIARLSTVVISCVGPYARYGERLIQACTKYGNDYVDLTGEYPWVKRMLVKYEAEAVRSSARIVQFGGVVSAIPDCGIYSLINYMQKEMSLEKGTPIIVSETCTLPTSSSMSGGTTESYFNSLSDASKYDINDVYFLNPPEKPYGPAQPMLSIFSKPKYFNEYGRYGFPYMYGPIDRMVVARSNALLNFAYGKEFIFEYPLFLIKSGLMAWLITCFGNIMQFLIKFRFFQSILLYFRNYIGPKPGEGNSRENMLKSRCNVYINARTKDNKKCAKLTVKMYGDLGYYLTARIITEQGMIFVDQRKDKKRRKIKGGMLTPAVAVGDELLNRLDNLKQFDITYEQQNGKSSKL